MNFSEITALFNKGASLLSAGRDALAQVKDAIGDSKTAISETEKEKLTDMLAQEEQETAAAIADARDAIAGYRAGR